ncbi:MAG TPA: hypothetical protein VMJ10_25260 [Kofleriaceae bacterium]|nr:hypothetical protein [Kofleriaceae bacterium]
MRQSSVALVLALASSRAWAGHHHVETDEEKSEDAVIQQVDSQPQLELGLAGRFGTFHTGPVYNMAAGVAVEGGVRLDKLALLGEYQLLGLFDPNDSSRQQPSTLPVNVDSAPAPAQAASPMHSTPGGVVHRLGANARYSVGRFLVAEGGIGVRGDLWLEGGLGEELIEWSGGGYLHRADVSIGAGAGIRFRGTQHHAGYQLGVRATFAEPPAGYMPVTTPTCAGPCDAPTIPHALDHSILGTFTIVFGG